MAVVCCCHCPCYAGIVAGRGDFVPPCRLFSESDACIAQDAFQCSGLDFIAAVVAGGEVAARDGTVPERMAPFLVAAVLRTSRGP